MLKIISKLLAARLRKYIGKLISCNQTVFIPGRQILDGVLVTNEIIDYAKRFKKECLTCKVDFAQAYDCVDWDFVRFMLKSTGFGSRWMKWMDSVVFTSTMSILVNGSPIEYFQVSKGLRQGDPMSPFLFTIVEEGLAGMVRKASSTCCKVDKFPFKFLGFIVGGNQRNINFWNPVISSLKAKLAGWKGKLLSIGGRVTLLNSVVSNIPSYQLSFYKVPSKVVKDIRAIQRKFLWQGIKDKRCVAWRAIWSGVMNVRYSNLRTRLWSRGVESYDLKDSFWWRDLVALCDNPRGILNNISVKIGNGNVTSFWNSRWIGSICLAELYPMLYQETIFKSATVDRLGSWRGNCWDWEVIRAYEVLGQEASLELAELQNMLLGIEVKANLEDVIVWPYDVSKCFTVRSCYKLLILEHVHGVEELGIVHGLNLIWEAHVPSKIKIFGWRLLHDRLPTRKQLLRRGIIEHNHEALCVFCGQVSEDPYHLFLLCPEIQRVWNAIIQWLELDSYAAVDCCSQICMGVTSLMDKMQSKRAAAIWVTLLDDLLKTWVLEGQSRYWKKP
ncbi:uncharacterized protein LOC131633987 [Vicia villosa]|uniref:uncharacterized protein LOC131633987 n=1 Tax=Vicia villosa TaxID=3911 RepID=UPI00273CDA14|nr:uncharacterized protein LOC131633987 [Vicia villosa]